MKEIIQRFKLINHFGFNSFLSLLALFIISKINFAQTLQRNLPVTNGIVNAMLKDSTTMYLAGEFTFVGQSTGRTAYVDTSTGLLDPNFPKVNGLVKVCVSDGNGGWYIGGSFTKVGDFYRNSIAHILKDGTVDTWNPSVTIDGVAGSGTVYTIAPFKNKIYIGGVFNKINSTPRYNVAALEGDTVLPWDPQIDISGFVTAFAPTDSVIYIGGNFHSVDAGKYQRAAIACIDTSGNATPWNPVIQIRDGYNPEEIYGLYLDDTTLYVWGNISTLDGYTREGIGSLYTTATTSGSYVTRWNPQSNPWVRGEPTSTLISSFLMQGDSIFIGGNFAHFGAYIRTGLALVSKSTGLVLPWNHYFGKTKTFWDQAYNTYDPAQINALAISGNKLYVAGSFDTAGTQERHNLASIDLSTDSLTNWSPQASDVVNSIVPSGSHVFAAGAFTAMNGVVRNRVAAIDLSTNKILPFNPNVGAPWPLCLAMKDSTLFIGGVFNTVGSDTQNCLAAVNKFSGKLIKGLPQVEYSVDAMYIHNNTLYIGGNVILSVGDSARHGLASIDLTTNQISSLNPFTFFNPHLGNALVVDFAAADSTLYFVGRFGLPTDTVMRTFGAINMNTGAVLPFNPNVNSAIKLLVSGNYIYTIGNFTAVNGNNQNYIAKIDRFTGAVANWDPNIFIGHNSSLTGDYNPNDIEIADSTLYICGPITGIGGYSEGGVGSINISTAEPTMWGAKINGDVFKMIVDKSSGLVYMCGYFDNVNDETQSYFAAVTDPSLGGINSVSNQQQTPRSFELMQNYPNPFNPSTIIKYSLTKTSFVTLKIYNMLGQVVRTLVEEQVKPGSYSMQWNGRDNNGNVVSSGAYIYRIVAGNFSQSKKMMLLK